MAHDVVAASARERDPGQELEAEHDPDDYVDGLARTARGRGDVRPQNRVGVRSQEEDRQHGKWPFCSPFEIADDALVRMIGPGEGHGRRIANVEGPGDSTRAGGLPARIGADQAAIEARAR